MKTLKTLFAALGFAALSFGAFATGGELGGTGSAEDPYVVMDADDLAAISANVGTYNGKTVVLGADIDLAGREWTPIGVSPRYYGTFDGRGHTISNMTITSANGRESSGLFGSLQNGLTEIKNLTMYGANVSAGNDTSAIVGRSRGTGTVISNCVVRNSSISGGTRVSALFGNNFSASPLEIVDCKVLNTTVTGNDSYQVGGIVGIGQNHDWTLSGCVISNVTVSTLDGLPTGLVCGWASKSIAISDLTILDCGTTSLIGRIAGSSSENAPIEICIDGSSSLDIGGFYANATGYWKVRMWSGKTTYNAPADQLAPGGTLSPTTVGGKTWYTVSHPEYKYISTEAELRDIATDFNENGTTSKYYGKYILMTNDIAMSAAEWVPIGGKQKTKDGAPFQLTNYFLGTFDGDGHVISGLTMTNTTDYTYNAMFGAGNGLTIRNLTLSDLNISLDKSNVSAFIAISTSGRCYLENCKLVDSKLSGSSRVGGFFPRPDYGANIVDCMVSNVVFTAFGNKEGVTIGAIMGVPSTMAAAYSTDTYITNVVVYASDYAAIGTVSASHGAYIGGDSTLMDVSGIVPAEVADNSIQVDAGLYSVAIPTVCLAPQRKNQRETIGETFWYRVVESHDGTGTENDPYILEDEDKLIEMATNPDKYSGTYIKMNADIALTKAFATAFGSDAKPFGGNFDGNKFSITCGDFVTADSFFGTVSNLVVKDLSISLTKPLIGKVLEDGTVSVKDTTVGGPASDAVISVNNGTLSLDNVVVTNAASALIANNAGAATVTGEDTDMDVAAICGSGSTGTMQMDNGRFHCTIPAAYVAEYYKSEADTEGGWYKVVPNKGSGTESDPYILMSEDDVQDFLANSKYKGVGVYTKLAKNVTMSAAVTPASETFKGVFDGNGKTIYNLTSTPAKATGGFFMDTEGAIVKNVTFVNATCTPKDRNCGFLTHDSTNSRFLNCTIDSSYLNGSKEFAAFAFTATGCVFSNCTISASSVRATSHSYGGGFVNRTNQECAFYECTMSNVTLDGCSETGNALMVYTANAGSTIIMRNCSISGSTLLPLITFNSATAVTIEGADTSIDASGVNGSTDTVSIKAGEFSFNPTAYVKAGKIETIEKGETTWYKVTPAVAKIGTEFYLTLQEAVNAGGDVVLLADVTESITVAADKTVNLDFGGKTLTAAGNFGIVNNGTLTLTNGTVVAKYPIRPGDNSFTTINGGTYTSVEGAITVRCTGATVVINDGIFTASDNAVLSSNGNAGMGGNTITVNGGTFTSDIVTAGYIACGVYAPNADTWNLNGGTFIVNGGVGVLARAGIVNVNGATFYVTAPAAAGWVGDTKVQIAGAVVAYDTQAGYSGYVAATDKIQVDTITIADGGISNVGIYGEATIVDKSAKLAAPEGYEWDANGKLVVKKAGLAILITDNGATTNEYETVQAAFDAGAAVEGSTVALLDNVGLTECLMVTNFNGTLDLNGFELTNDESYKYAGSWTYLMKVGGITDFTVTNGTITVKDGHMVYVYSKATMTIAATATIAEYGVTGVANPFRLYGKTYDTMQADGAATLNVYGTMTRQKDTLDSDWENGVVDQCVGTTVINVYEGALLNHDVSGSRLFKMADGNPTVNVYGGTLKCGDQVFHAYAPMNTILIKGGTFDVDRLFSHGKDDPHTTLAQLAVSGLGANCTAKFKKTDSEIESLGYFCDAGYAPIKGSDGYYAIGRPAAKVGTEYYLTLAEAITAAGAGATIAMCGDYAAGDAEVIKFSKDATLDLCGKTLTVPYSVWGAYNFGIQADATVTFTNGTVSLTGSGSDIGIDVYGTLNAYCTIKKQETNPVVFNIFGNATVNGNSETHVTACGQIFQFKSESSTPHVNLTGGTYVCTSNFVGTTSIRGMFHCYKKYCVPVVSITDGEYTIQTLGLFDLHGGKTGYGFTCSLGAGCNAKFSREQPGVQEYLAEGYKTKIVEGWVRVVAIDYATLTITQVDNCSIVVSNATAEVATGAKFDKDSKVQLTVYRTPADGYELDNCAAQETITMTEDKTVTAAVKSAGVKPGEQKPLDVPSTATEAEAQAEAEKVAPQAANDEAAAAGQANVLKSVAVRDTEGNWVVEAQIDTNKMVATQKVEDTVAKVAESLPSLADATVGADVSVPLATNVTPGLYYSLGVTADLGDSDGFVEGDRVLATGSAISVTVKKPADAADKCFFKVFVNMTPKPANE